MGRNRWLAAVVAGVALAGAACGDGTVRIAYDPRPGSTRVYELRVRTETTLTLDGAPRRSTSDATLRAAHTVLGRSGDRVRLRVRIERSGSPARTLEALLDRSGHLVSVERVEGLPAAALGDLGLAELFPGAAPAVPDRPLRPGETWAIDDRLALPGTAASRLRGTGRLVALDGGRGARVHASTALPVRRTVALGDGELTLRGTSRTVSDTRYALADGTVERSSARTTADFDVSLAPPPGQAGSPVPGTLRVTVRTELQRA